MTIKEFYIKLTETKEKLHWSFDKYGKLRGERGYKCYCPITAVRGDDTQYGNAANLGVVDGIDNQLIVWASDNVLDGVNCSGPEKRMVKYIRKALLKALNLEERK